MIGKDTIEPDDPPVMNTDDSRDPKDQPGEFTRMFRPVAKPNEPESAATPSKVASPPPGEFTQMFSTPAKPVESSDAPAIPAMEPEPVSPKVPEKQPQRPERASQFRTPGAMPDPGEFTRLFRPPAGVPPQALPPPVEKGPGDFTQMFSAPPAPKQATPEPAKPVEEPGSFTKFFREPAPKPAPPANPPATPPVAPGQDSEFTRFFKDPLPPAGREVNWKAIENQPPPLTPSKAPGEFTRMFGRPEGANSGQASGSGAKESATDLFASSKSGSTPKNATGQVDEFAKVFAQPPAVSEPKPPAVREPQAPAPATVKPASQPAIKATGPPVLVLIVIIAAVLILAGCALYYFVLRK